MLTNSLIDTSQQNYWLYDENKLVKLMCEYTLELYCMGILLC